MLKCTSSRVLLLEYRGFNLNYTTDLYCGLNFKHTVGSQICTVGLNFSITITTVLCTAVQYGTVQYGTVQYGTRFTLASAPLLRPTAPCGCAVPTAANPAVVHEGF